MFSITKKTDYALLLLTDLAQKTDDQFSSIRQIALNYKLPYKFLSQIAIELKNLGFLSSKEGLGGGYRLSKPASEISITNIITSLEGPIIPVKCLYGDHKCKHQSQCRHIQLMKRLSQIIIDNLNQNSLKDLCLPSKT